MWFFFHVVYDWAMAAFLLFVYQYRFPCSANVESYVSIHVVRVLFDLNGFPPSQVKKSLGPCNYFRFIEQNAMLVVDRMLCNR